MINRALRTGAKAAAVALVRGAMLLPAGKPAVPPTFYRDVLPILQEHCQSCHRPRGIAPMPFVTYRETKPWAGAIAQAARSRKMPPWFADPCCGQFSNDPSLAPQQISVLASWAAAGATAGDPRRAPPPLPWAGGWNIGQPKGQPDRVLKMPAPVEIPAHGDVEYTY